MATCKNEAISEEYADFIVVDIPIPLYLHYSV